MWCNLKNKIFEFMNNFIQLIEIMNLDIQYSY